jgi:hypothetical protein
MGSIFETKLQQKTVQFEAALRDYWKAHNDQQDFNQEVLGHKAAIDTARMSGNCETADRLGKQAVLPTDRLEQAGTELALTIHRKLELRSEILKLATNPAEKSAADRAIDRIETLVQLTTDIRNLR